MASEKGFKVEELLRSYFLRAGCYVIRGVPFKYENFDITDIDLWLYSRTSSFSREITIVDSKNKKTPQAIERIFWTKGLAQTIKATNAIVATMDKREAVRKFGKENDILVLDGNFIQKLINQEDIIKNRISDEELINEINSYNLNKLDGDWKGRIIYCKSLIISGLDFNSCNAWLDHAKFFALQSISNTTHKSIALRCLYLICSYIVIAIDYILRELSFYEMSERKKILYEGFTFGSNGDLGTKKILDISTSLIVQNFSDGKQVAKQIRNKIENQLSDLNSNVLSEFFSKNDLVKNLFSIAREFEELAMNRDFKNHNEASTNLRSVLFCFMDFWKIERSNLL